MSLPHLVMPQVMDMLFNANDALHANCRHFGAGDPARYVRDFRTIRLNYGQRTGKTVYVKSAAGYDDLVVVTNDDMLNWYLEGGHVKGYITKIDTLLAGMSPGKRWHKRYPRIWLDDWPALCFTFDKPRLQTWEQQLQFYQGLVYDVDQQVIILG